MNRNPAKLWADSAAVDAKTAIEAAAFAKEQADKLEAAAAAEKAEKLRLARVELTAMEPRGLASLNPRNRLWRELDEIDARVGRLQQSQMEAVADVSLLGEQLAGAEDADRAALAAWHADGARGRRPEPSAPTLGKQLEARRADAVA